MNDKSDEFPAMSHIGQTVVVSGPSTSSKTDDCVDKLSTVDMNNGYLDPKPVLDADGADRPIIPRSLVEEHLATFGVSGLSADVIDHIALAVEHDVCEEVSQAMAYKTVLLCDSSGLNTVGLAAAARRAIDEPLTVQHLTFFQGDGLDPPRN